MSIDQLVLLFVVVIANAVLLVALQFSGRGRGQPGQSAEGAMAGLPSEGTPVTGPSRLLTAADAFPAVVYQRVVRVTSLIFIGAGMVVVALTANGNSTATVVVMALGAFVIVLFQDVLPAGSLGRWRLPIEAAAAVVFLTVLLALTGGYGSPFFLGYLLLLGAAGIWAAGHGPVLLVAFASSAYLIGVLMPTGVVPLTPADFGRVAINLVAMSLVTYVAATVGREQRLARESALRLSRFDSLTGLHSRDHFANEIEQEILRAARSGRPFALLMLDLDGLKAANDRFGHSSGDQLLRAVSDTLAGAIRATDIAARYGGDEFVLLLPDTNVSGAALVADKVRIDIGRIALPRDGAAIRTSVSIGLVTFPDDGRTSTELMRRADLAMYEAKHRGRDQVVRFARDTQAPSESATGVAAAGAPANASAVAQTEMMVNWTPELAAMPPAPPTAVPAESVGRAPWDPPARAPWE